MLAKLTRRFSAEQLKRPYKRKRIGVHLRYGDQTALRLLLPETLDAEVDEVFGKLRDQDIDDVPDLLKRIACLEELRCRLEVLLGSRPEAPLDESLACDSELEAARSAADRHARREKLAATGGQLLTAAFQFLGELLPPTSPSVGATEAASGLPSNLKRSLSELVEHDDQGRQRLTFLLPDSAALDNLANVLARLLAQGPRATLSSCQRGERGFTLHRRPRVGREHD